MTQRNDGGPDAAGENIEPNFRDMCAMFAMQGFIAAGYLDGAQNYDQAEAQLARDAHSMADALFAARRRT